MESRYSATVFTRTFPLPRKTWFAADRRTLSFSATALWVMPDFSRASFSTDNTRYRSRAAASARLLKALLNNLEPRVASYAGWLGRDARVRHGDTGAGDRKRQMTNRPSMLLTTPESLEAMLVS